MIPKKTSLSLFLFASITLVSANALSFTEYNMWEKIIPGIHCMKSFNTNTGESQTIFACSIEEEEIDHKQLFDNLLASNLELYGKLKGVQCHKIHETNQSICEATIPGILCTQRYEANSHETKIIDTWCEIEKDSINNEILYKSLINVEAEYIKFCSDKGDPVDCPPLLQ